MANREGKKGEDKKRTQKCAPGKIKISEIETRKEGRSEKSSRKYKENDKEEKEGGKQCK
jgi:hypothetical protein